MRKGRSPAAVPVPVARALRKLGHDIRDARRRRRIPVTILAERASVSRMTLNKAEKGGPLAGKVLIVCGEHHGLRLTGLHELPDGLEHPR